MRQLFRSLLLISAAALPMIIFAVAMIVQFNDQQQDAVETQLRQSARSAIRAVDRQIMDQLTTLGTLASTPLLDKLQLEDFRAHAERVVAHNDYWLGLQLFDLDRQQAVIDIAAPDAGYLPQAAIRQALDAEAVRDDYIIGGVIISQDLPQSPAFVPLGQVVRSEGGGTFLVAAAIDTRAFSEALVAEMVPESWTMAVLDRDFTIAGRTRSPELFIGTRATSSLTDEIQRANENFFFSTNKEGHRVYTAFARSSFSGWTSALGVPAEVVEVPIRQSLWATVGGGIGAFTLAVLLGMVLIRSNARREALERQLEAERATERRLSDIAANFPGIIFRRELHPDGRITYPYLSEGGSVFSEILRGVGMASPTLEDLSRVIAPEDRLRWREAILRSARTLGPYFAEGRLMRPDGSILWARSAANARQRSDGTVVWDGVVLDITDRIKAEEDLRNALAEKESLLDEKTTLLNEVHHRVKNNLQIMTSLLRMEQRQIENAQARARLEIVSQRIQVMARLHEQLYASGDLARIDVGETLHQICQDIGQLQGRPDVDLRVDAESVRCDLRIAIPLGLLANELITNSLKHGFPDGRKGVVHVSLRRAAAPNTIELVVADDGIGASAPFGSEAEAGIGTRLVSALARQIGAEIRSDNSKGTRLVVVIPSVSSETAEDMEAVQPGSR